MLLKLSRRKMVKFRQTILLGVVYHWSVGTVFQVLLIFTFFWYHLSPDLLKIFKSFFRTLWRTYLNIWVFLLYRHMPAKQALSSYILPKGMKEIIQESLRRSGYFNYVNIFQVLEWQYGIVELLK